MSKSSNSYVNLKRQGMLMRDLGGYDIHRGEMNPAVFEEFVGLILENNVSPVIWEPFAGHTGKNKNKDFVKGISGLELISFDIEPCDSRVKQADSTKEGPGKLVGGVFFHPPYYGSMSMSSKQGEISSIGNENDYLAVLNQAAELTRMSLEPKGLVCAIGRDYRHNGKRIRMDKWLDDIFEDMGMKLLDVWQSEPDVAIILEAGDV